MIFASIFGVIMLFAGIAVFATSAGTLNHILGALLCGQGMLIAVVSVGFFQVTSRLKQILEHGKPSNY